MVRFVSDFISLKKVFWLDLDPEVIKDVSRTIKVCIGYGLNIGVPIQAKKNRYTLLLEEVSSRQYITHHTANK